MSANSSSPSGLPSRSSRCRGSTWLHGTPWPKPRPVNRNVRPDFFTVKLVLRSRTGPRAALETYRFGEVEVDFHKGEARKKGKPLDLSPRELRLLEYFIRHRGEVVAREALLDAVWGYDTAPLTRTVDMHVAKLRKKIEDPRSEPKFLITVHRMGYKFTG